MGRQYGEPADDFPDAYSEGNYCHRVGRAGLCSAILRAAPGCDGVDQCNRHLFRHLGDERSHHSSTGRKPDTRWLVSGSGSDVTEAAAATGPGPGQSAPATSTPPTPTVADSVFRDGFGALQEDEYEYEENDPELDDEYDEEFDPWVFIHGLPPLKARPTAFHALLRDRSIRFVYFSSPHVFLSTYTVYTR